MTKVFLSPSDQDNNPVLGGGTEQQYAQARCARAAEVLRSYGYEVKVSSAGIGDDTGGFLASIEEGNAWGPDLYVADHTNAGNGRASGVQAYCYTPDPESVRLGQCINARMDQIVPGGASIQDGQHLGEVNSSNATAVLMESGYHDNPSDAEVIRTKTREMGEAIAYGILDYYGTTINNQEDNMPLSNEDLKNLHNAVWFGAPGADLIPNSTSGRGEWAYTSLGNMQRRIAVESLGPQIAALSGKVAGLSAAIEALSAGQVAGLSAAIEALSAGEGVDQASITQAVQAAVTKAMADVSITLSNKES